VIAEMFSGAFPLLDRVTVCAALDPPTAWKPKYSDDEERLAPEALPPIPVNGTTWGAEESDAITVRLPVLVPGAEGVKVTPKPHPTNEPSCWPFVGQEFGGSWKSLPVTVIFWIVIGGAPVPLPIEAHC
jgi:hypothetical protein